MILPACSAIAAVTAGCECPMFKTAHPAVKSRYDLPSLSKTLEPSPRTSTGGIRRTTCM